MSYFCNKCEEQLSDVENENSRICNGCLKTWEETLNNLAITHNVEIKYNLVNDPLTIRIKGKDKDCDTFILDASVIRPNRNKITFHGTIIMDDGTCSSKIVLC
ncbi:hypothetical protein P4534_21230 [Peribacillus butanolivorans]|uniref:hypothetical protein n=1 Tax=Peribacillus butanolivorans TaxID=421767 RepID=UPI002E24435B|nr:hypothetical protein [Peribacillus butanolivorans]